ncbi:hypothetical protein DJ533_10075 [Acinetobacter defluvii]|uniref:Uncharacterized protein n=1 Tax=Acinetobacter defluvii TaxID=1871111 RepID=A0A2S2FEZ1_9GAMM|nr:hypothetical protein [Acinetobacter defluvii]AWL28892.1 hypothetical protein DJ533_10075 [Acinetobacter defluvii]
MLPFDAQQHIHPHQWTAQQLLKIAPTLLHVFQEQWAYLEHIHAQNMLQIDVGNKQFSIANGLLVLDFNHQSEILQFQVKNIDLPIDKISKFILQEMIFFTGNRLSQHPTTVKTNVQVLRQILMEQVFQWVDAENRIEQFIYNISIQDAALIDQLLIQQQYYDQPHLTVFAEYGTQIPLDVELNIKHLCLVNSVKGEQFIAVNELIPIYEDLCFSAQQFLPEAIYRLLQCFYPEQFSLMNLIDHQQDFQLLRQHAIEKPNVIAYAKLMHRGYWQYQDLLDKKHFLDVKSPYWDDSQLARLPVFYQAKAVNWIFKQKLELNLWLSQVIQNPNVRVAVTALSFVDCSHVHPQVILLTLKYFQNIAARLFLFDCQNLSEQQQWFLNPENQKYRLNENREHLDQKVAISASMLYIEEWLELVDLLSQNNTKRVKHCYAKLSRVMQAYMLFLQQIVQTLPTELWDFIDPKTHQQHDFFKALKQSKLEVSEFRQYFRHQFNNQIRSISIFDSYVADYLIDHFSQHRVLNKNLTWQGLFHQAYAWHQQLEFDNTLDYLKNRVDIEHWQRISPEAIMHFEGWCFEELHELERVIQESVDYKHCLAHSYTERMLAQEYVAFHIYPEKQPAQCLTLGCIYKEDQLHFDQLKYPSNRAADEACLTKVYAFITEFNLMLRKRRADERILA